MTFLELARDKRFSVRKFKEQPVDRDKLDYILEAGRIAPTACNYQPQRILVVESEEAREKLKLCTPCHFDAPVVLVICYDKTTCWKNKKNGTCGGEVDASIVTTHMMLAAAEQGLGATWVGAFKMEELCRQFELPDYLVPVALLPIGYPDDDVEAHPWHSLRFDIGHTVFYNSFDGITEGEEH